MEDYNTIWYKIKKEKFPLIFGQTKRRWNIIIKFGIK